MKRQGWILGTLVTAVGFSGAACDRNDRDDAAVMTAAPAGATSAQSEAFAALQTSTHEPWTWLQSDARRTPLHLGSTRTGERILRLPAQAEPTTLWFLRNHRELFTMREPAEELVLERSETDDLGMTHARFQQTVKGVPVLGAELAAHYDAEGHLASLDANYTPGIDLDVVPTLAVGDARSRAIADVLSRSGDVQEADLGVGAGELAVDVSGETPRLVWSWRVRAITGEHPAIWVVNVDAKTGAIVDSFNDLHFVQATAPGLNGKPQTIEVTPQTDGTFALSGTIEGVRIRTFTAATGDVRPGTLLSAPALTGPWDPAGVDAHAHTAAVVRYFKERHNRNSIDGIGGELTSTVHYLKNLNNAFWDGIQMTYGDGDGVSSRSYGSSLGIVAHELTHGIVERTSNLRGPAQIGALNEALGDIMGACVAHYVKPDPIRNWAPSLDNRVAPIIASPVRYLADPASVGDPAHMQDFLTDQQDDGQIHANANIITHAMYLMTVGGTNGRSKIPVKYGIGFEKAEKIWFRANAKYWLTSTNFAQAAAGVLSAAKDVGLTQNEQNIVECAFKATGIVNGACAALTDPSPSTPDAGAAPTTSSPANDDDDDETPDGGSPKKTPRKTPAPGPSSCAVGHGGGGAFGGGTLLLGFALVLRASRRARARRR